MADNKQIKGKTVLISGAGSGIGLAMAKEFGQKGATIIGTDIHQDRVDLMLAELKKIGVKAFGYKVDHANLADVKVFVEKVQKEVGQVDILCCNAGVGHAGKIDSITLDLWKWVIDVNIWGTLYMINFFLPSMVARKQGDIMITASGNGLNPLGAMAAYSMTKAALVSLSQVMRMDLHVHNINVSALCPGVIKTNIMKDAFILGAKNKEGAIEFYTTQGVDPAVVAKAAVKGLLKKKGIISVPWNQVSIPSFLYRLSPTMMVGLGRMLFKRGRNLLGPYFKEENI